MMIKLDLENDFLCAEDGLESHGFKQVGFIKDTPVFEKNGKQYFIKNCKSFFPETTIISVDLEEMEVNLGGK